MADPYAVMSGVFPALYGSPQGGAREHALPMLTRFGTNEAAQEYIQPAKGGQVRRIAFGRRVDRKRGPRAQFAKRIADRVFGATELGLLLLGVQETERIAREDECFISHKVNPTVNFYPSLSCFAMGFLVETFPVLFATARVPDWLAQWWLMFDIPIKRSASQGSSISVSATAVWGTAQE